MTKNDFILGYIQTHGVSPTEDDEQKRVQFLSRVYDRVTTTASMYERDLDWIQKTPILHCRLSTRVATILYNHGITTAAQLVDTPKAILEGINGLGRKGLREIKDLLNAHGVRLK